VPWAACQYRGDVILRQRRAQRGEMCFLDHLDLNHPRRAQFPLTEATLLDGKLAAHCNPRPTNNGLLASTSTSSTTTSEFNPRLSRVFFPGNGRVVDLALERVALFTAYVSGPQTVCQSVAKTRTNGHSEISKEAGRCAGEGRQRTL